MKLMVVCQEVGICADLMSGLFFFVIIPFPNSWINAIFVVFHRNGRYARWYAGWHAWRVPRYGRYVEIINTLFQRFHSILYSTYD